jgi:hypothetical protein
MKELGFIELTESAVNAWRSARDEVSRHQRIEQQLNHDAAAYRARFGYTMPDAIAQEIKRDLTAQEQHNADAREGEARTALAASETTIQTVRQASERLPRPAAADLQVAQAWLLEGSLSAITATYLTADDSDPFVFAVEEAVRLQVPKFLGASGSREDADTALRLSQAIKDRARKRGPAWTHEAEKRLTEAMSASDDAYLRLKKMRLIS